MQIKMRRDSTRCGLAQLTNCTGTTQGVDLLIKHAAHRLCCPAPRLAGLAVLTPRSMSEGLAQQPALEKCFDVTVSQLEPASGDR